MLFKKIYNGIVGLLQCLGRGDVARVSWGGGGGQGFVDDCLMSCWEKHNLNN